MSGALCSDHVNYLILRYLQEAGHEGAATAFWRDWHRQPEFRNPENYPFAQVVRRGELVNVIQDGLHHDALISRVKKNERKFHFTNSNAREALESRDGTVLENGTMGSRPSSSAKRKSKPTAMRPPDEFPTPAPKRRKSSEGRERVHLNGDAMDVDAASASASADADEEGEPVSPAVASEPEIVEVPERYDSMDVAVQTDVKTGPKTSTMYWKIDKSGTTIYHSVWNPDPDSKNANTLLTVGESLCRFHHVPEDVENARDVLSVDEPSLSPNSTVTATAWHPAGHSAVCAIDSIRELPDGRQEPQQALLSLNRDTGTSSQYLFPPLLEPAGIVLALRYSSGGDYLLVARTNLNRGLILVYDSTTTDTSKSEPVAWRIFEHQVLDVAWTQNLEFAVCGEQGLFESFKLLKDSPNTDESLTSETIPMHGLYKLDAILPEDTSTCKWDKFRHDDRTAISVLASTEAQRMLIGVQRPDASTTRFLGEKNFAGQLTALAFQRDPSCNDNDKALLALAFEEGFCMLYANYTDDSDNIETEHILILHLSDGPALALAWSPDGAFLAVAGTDLVRIWKTDALLHRDLSKNKLERRNDSIDRPLVTWRPDSTATGSRNGEHQEEKPLTEPSLSWSADGESLSFAIDKQIAIIRFRPPLSQKDKATSPEINGHRSP